MKISLDDVNGVRCRCFPLKEIAYVAIKKYRLNVYDDYLFIPKAEELITIRLKLKYTFSKYIQWDVGYTENTCALVALNFNPSPPYFTRFVLSNMRLKCGRKAAIGRNKLPPTGSNKRANANI